MIEVNEKKQQDIISLVKDCYQPYFSENFDEDDFFNAIQKKIDSTSVQSKISLISSELENQYLSRQEKFYQAKNRFESGSLQSSKKKKVFSKKSFLLFTLLFVCFASCFFIF